MPRFQIIEGIKIECYSGESHLPPHVHGKYSGEEVLIEIENQAVYAGYLPGKKLKVARRIIRKHKRALLVIFFQLNPHLYRNENKR